jgi:hypothetical protein
MPIAQYVASFKLNLLERLENLKDLKDEICQCQKLDKKNKYKQKMT